VITQTLLPSGAVLRWDHANREGVVTVGRRADAVAQLASTTEAAACVGALLSIGSRFAQARVTLITVWCEPVKPARKGGA